MELDTDADVDPGDLFDELEEPAEFVQTEAAREQVQETMRAAAGTNRSVGGFGRLTSSPGSERRPGTDGDREQTATGNPTRRQERAASDGPLHSPATSLTTSISRSR